MKGSRANRLNGSAGGPRVKLPKPAPAPTRSRRPAAAPAPEPQADCAGVTVFTMAFGDLAHVLRSMLPAKAPPDQRAALEYWGSTLAASLAEAWRGRARKQAVSLAVLPDHVTTPRPIGTAEIVYADPLVSIGMRVVEQAGRVDVEALAADLVKSGVKATLVARLVRKHTKAFPGAHIFTASLAG